MKKLKRFRDEYGCMAVGNLFDVHMLVAALNNIHSYSPFSNQIFNEYKFGLNILDLFELNRIKFTLDINKTNPTTINILDMNVSWNKDLNMITTKANPKSMENFCYLKVGSSHIKSIFTKGTPKTVALRLRA